MGKLFIGDVEPVSLGLIEKLYAGTELMWPTAVVVIDEYHPILFSYESVPISYYFGQAVESFAPSPNTPLVEGIYFYQLGAFAQYTSPAIWNTGLLGDPNSYETTLTLPSESPLPTAVWKDGVATFSEGATSISFSTVSGGACTLHIRNISDQVIVKRITFNSQVFTPITDGWVFSSDGDESNIFARLTWNTNADVVVSGNAGISVTSSGIRDWWIGTPLPPTLWVRWRLIQNTSGAPVAVNRNTGGTAIPQNTWVDFNAAGGLYFNYSSSGSSGYDRRAYFELDFSTTVNGGAVAATSDFYLRVQKN